MRKEGQRGSKTRSPVPDMGEAGSYTETGENLIARASKMDQLGSRVLNRNEGSK